MLADDAGLVGAVAAIVTGVGLALRQLRHSLGQDSAAAQESASRTLYEMLESRLKAQSEELAALRQENRELREELSQVHAELREMRERCAERLADAGDVG
jgi:predicted RNase H-like nuclease (RuvC/YqgF family)